MKVFRPKPLHANIQQAGYIGDHNRWTEGWVIAYIKDLEMEDILELANLVYESVNDYPVYGIDRQKRWRAMSPDSVRDWVYSFTHWNYQEQILIPVSAHQQRTEGIVSLYSFIKG